MRCQNSRMTVRPIGVSQRLSSCEYRLSVTSETPLQIAPLCLPLCLPRLDVTQLTHTQGNEAHLAWSPDGSFRISDKPTGTQRTDDTELGERIA
jgi:hypothetical protein